MLRSKDDYESAIWGIVSITFRFYFFLISDIQLVTKFSALDISGTLPSAILTALLASRLPHLPPGPLNCPLWSPCPWSCPL